MPGRHRRSAWCWTCTSRPPCSRPRCVLPANSRAHRPSRWGSPRASSTSPSTLMRTRWPSSNATPRASAWTASHIAKRSLPSSAAGPPRLVPIDHQLELEDYEMRFGYLAAAAIAGAVSLVAMSGATAADYPTRTIRFVVPYAAGGTSDIVARHIGQRFSERIGQPVIIDNRAGAGGSIGTEVVAKAQPDGYTVLFHSGAVAVEPVSGKKLSYDVRTDLDPITMAVVGPFALLV